MTSTIQAAKAGLAFTLASLSTSAAADTDLKTQTFPSAGLIAANNPRNDGLPRANSSILLASAPSATTPLTREEKLAKNAERIAEIQQNKLETAAIVSLVKAGDLVHALEKIQALKDQPQRLAEISKALKVEGRAKILGKEGLTPEQKTELVGLLYSEKTIAAAQKVKDLVDAALKPEAKVTADTFKAIRAATGYVDADIKTLLTYGPLASKAGLLGDLATIYTKKPAGGQPDIDKAYGILMKGFGN